MAPAAVQIQQGPSFVGPAALREDAPQADSRQRKPEGPPGTYQVLVGSGDTLAVVQAAQGPSAIITIINKSKHQVKQEEQVDKSRSKVSFSLSSITLQHASGTGLQQGKVQGRCHEDPELRQG